MNHWAMTIALTVLLCVGGRAVAASYSPPDSDQWQAVEPAKKLEAFRAFVSPMVHDGRLRVRLEGPAAGVDHAASIAVHGSEDQPIARGALTLEANRSRPRRGQERGEIESVSGETMIDVSKLDDGTYTAELFVDWRRNPPSKLQTRLKVPFRVVREQVAAIADEKRRDEVSVWLTDHNLQEPIWGKIPTWTNLPTALKQGADGDPFRDLRGFVLRSYFNPQLRRRQPYTVYVPRSLETDKPAALMILLHGSGGDYRNLVADHAAGQRFEEHPMLIANAGAFAHQEYRHMALNDVRWVIEDMKRKYNVDAGRIYGQGISLGGRGVLDLAARLPDTFAAVSAQGVYGVMPLLMDTTFPSRVDPLRLSIEQRKDVRTILPRMKHVPVEMVFGYHDPTTPPVNARMIAKTLMLSRQGVDGAGEVVERGFDDDHNITMPNYDWASTRKWFLTHEKRAAIEAKPLPGPQPRGPIWRVWEDPVWYVYEDGGDEATTKLLRESAESSARLDATFGEPTLPVIAASKLTARQMEDCNVILFSRGKGKLRDKLSPRFPDGDEDIAERVRAANVRVALGPGLDGAGRYTLTVDITADEPVSLRSFGYWDSGFHTDWVVGKTVERRGRRGLGIPAAGHYGQDWQPTAMTTIDPRGPMVLR